MWLRNFPLAPGSGRGVTTRTFSGILSENIVFLAAATIAEYKTAVPLTQ